MKYYLTKEWFYDIVYPLSLKKRIKVSPYAQTTDEKTYRQLYEKELKSFMTEEKKRLTPFDPHNVSWVDKALSRAGVSKQNIKALKKVLGNGQEKPRSKKVSFDEETIKQKFDNDLRNRIEICKKFPGEILNEVADLRVFALGHMTEKVKALAEAYLEEKDRQNLDLMRLSYNQTNRAETSLGKGIRFGNYLLKIIADIQKKGNIVYIEFVGLPTLVIRNAKVIEWESVFYKQKNGFFPAEIKPLATTTAEAVEAARIEDRYELHFLMCNENSEGKRWVWNFTVSGTDIDSEGEHLIPPEF